MSKTRPDQAITRPGRLRFPSRLLLSLVLLGPAAGAGFASSGTEAAETKLAAIALLEDLERHRREARVSPDPRLVLFMKVDVPGFHLRQASVRAGNLEQTSHRYPAADARALYRGGWHRFVDVPIAVGSHPLVVEFSGRFWDAPASQDDVAGHMEVVFDQPVGGTSIVIPVIRDTLRATPKLGTPEALPHSAMLEHPLAHTHVARFERWREQYFSALVELGLSGSGKAAPASHSADVQQLWIESLIGAGLGDRAEDLARDFPAASSIDTKLDLAQLAFQGGDLQRASQILQEARPQIPDALLARWIRQMVDVLLAEGRYQDAIARVSEGRGTRISADERAALRYNLAVALIGAGRTEDGRRHLGELGTLDHDDPTVLDLRDKATLALGYQYLDAQDGIAAKTAFLRVRQTGLFANRALLGLGWAEIAAGSNPATPTDATAGGDDPTGLPKAVDPTSLGALIARAPAMSGFRRVAIQPDATRVLPLAEQEAIQRALLPWSLLLSRDPTDPAVQEGQLAIAWTLQQQRDDEQSLAFYEESVKTLESARNRIARTRASVLTGRMVRVMLDRDPASERGWYWDLVDLPNMPETHYLQRLIAQHRFQETLKTHRDAEQLRTKLDSWRSSLDESATTISGDAVDPWARKRQALTDRTAQISSRLAETARQASIALQDLAIQELDGQQRQVETYLTASRSAIAQIYERQIAPSSP